MIIFHYDILDQFLHVLPRNVANEIFIQYLEPTNELEMTNNTIHQVILQFLGKPDSGNVHLSTLHQCALNIKTQADRQQIMDQIKEALQKTGQFTLIQGKISEVVHSY
ncbi:MAG: hypothetical protein ACTSVZ_06940 [Promethearchaeota archaeon]